MHPQKPIRVLMLLENNPYPQDGRVRQEAISLTAAGYQVMVIAPKSSEQSWYEKCQNVSVYRFPGPPEADGFFGYLWEYGYSMFAIFLLSLFVFLRHGFDIIHTHNPPDTFFPIVATYKLLGKGFIFDHHDLSPELYYVRFVDEGNPTIHRILLLFEKLSFWLADHIITVNQSYKDIEIERGGVSETKITIVRNGPDLNRLLLMDPDPSLRRLGRMTLCYVGVMGYQDGVDYLLRAIQILVYELKRNDIFCLLVGGGDFLSVLKRLADELDLTDYVEFTGWVDFDDVARYLNTADICLAPEPSNSYNDRSTMIKMMEYMALQKPIVAFDLPEHRFTALSAAVYAVANDEYDFAQQIVLLMDNPKQCQKMGLEGRERVEKALAWQHQEKQLLKAYEEFYKNKQNK